MSFHPRIMSSTRLCGCRIRLSFGQAHNLSWAEPGQEREFALLDLVLVGVLVVDFDHAADEKLLLFGGAGLPIVGLVHENGETLVASPLLVHGLLFVLGSHVHVVLDLR